MSKVKYGVELYDPDKILKMKRWFLTEIEAMRDGENWEMLSKGNSFLIIYENLGGSR